MCFPLALRLFVTGGWWLQHNGQHLKSVTQCLISSPLTVHPRALHKIHEPNGSSPLATEMRATSGPSANLLMQLHTVTSRLFSEHLLKKKSQMWHYVVDIYISRSKQVKPYRYVHAGISCVCPIGETTVMRELQKGGYFWVIWRRRAHFSRTNNLDVSS